MALCLSVQFRFPCVVRPASRPEKWRRPSGSDRASSGDRARGTRALIRAPSDRSSRAPRLLPIFPLGLRAVSFPIRGTHPGLGDVHPDFYLPEQPYIELTTMKQSLVTPKNRTASSARSSGQSTCPAVPQDYQQLLAKGIRSARGPEPAQAGHRHILISGGARTRVRALAGRSPATTAAVHRPGRHPQGVLLSRDLGGRSRSVRIDYWISSASGRPAARAGSHRADIDYPSGEARGAVETSSTPLDLDISWAKLRGARPRSIEIVTLLDRPGGAWSRCGAYVGFPNPTTVVGYARLRELYRTFLSSVR